MPTDKDLAAAVERARQQERARVYSAVNEVAPANAAELIDAVEDELEEPPVTLAEIKHWDAETVNDNWGLVSGLLTGDTPPQAKPEPLTAESLKRMPVEEAIERRHEIDEWLEATGGAA